MTKEELKKEAEGKYIKKSKRLAYEWSGAVYKEGYKDGALPREKQIQIDAEQIRALQKHNGELTDRVKELEAQVKYWKSEYDKLFNEN